MGSTDAPFYCPTTSTRLEGKTLIVPVVTVANLPQLAADLLIATFALKRIGLFDPRDVIPVVGAREDGEPGLTLPLELYGKDNFDVVILQQRSPALKSRKQNFVDSILEFIRSSNFRAVLFMCGVDMSNRTDAQMMTPIFHIQPTNTPALEGSPLSTIKALQIPAYTTPSTTSHSSKETQAPSASSADDVPFMPGGGLSRRILSSISKASTSDTPAWSTPVAALVQFVLEGDNRFDAGLMATAATRVLGGAAEEIVKAQGGFKEPTSWRQGLFGTPHDQTLYG
ncbi:hypothetical protein PUNSTDRAFT_99231 [Punctularia strigosozonata HHB-11173 SS5]|uniref:uncharacterized protein n=1 Tax=Punctularia strigosozonata (strain HHB-11173) TaxID=741275 RepID=UPI0004417A81|nr:uncharacterized protein PUNSTDRAFT_99231 [Punctularia strigosozonata HHB-11173 SS5]EIN11912.1 hypothetical protein PUNSTDRAFT_99231 [Punctularia strigosozonata HHB-11173 SS5]